MSLFQKYMELDDLSQKCFNNNDFVKAQKTAEEQKRLRENNFTKADWEQLISQSTGRAKYEYTRMMNAKFPD